MFKKVYNFGKTKAVEAYNEVTLYWNRPKVGEHVPYKEVLNFSVGQFGREFIGQGNGMFGLGVGNMFIAFAIGIRPMHIALMGMIMGFIGLVFPLIRAQLVDNTRTKWGRFRPYIAIFGFVVVGLAALLAWLPWESMPYTEKLAWLFGIHIVHGLVAPLYFESINELRTVITPNAHERAKIISVSSIFFSIAPTLFSPLVMFVAGMAAFGGIGFRVLSFYRYFLVPLSAFGLFFSIFAAIGTKERVVADKKYVPKIPVYYGMLLIYKNKYWWINTIRGTLSFTSGWAIVLFIWMFMFRYQNLAARGFLEVPLGTASLIAMVSTPFLIKKFNSVKLWVFVNVGMIIMWLLLLGVMYNMWLFMLVNYLYTVVMYTTIVLSPHFHANVKDYTQYQTGKRMDFTFGAAGLITFPIGMAIGLVQPLFMEWFGFTGNSDIFFDPALNQTYFNWLIILSIVGSIITIIPLYWYDLNETKHAQIIAALQYRACLKDWQDENVSAKQIKNCVELINKAKENAVLEMPDWKAIRNVKWKLLFTFKLKDWWAKRKEYNQAISLMDTIKSAQLLLQEQNKFDEPFMQLKVALAEKFAGKPISELVNADPTFRQEALLMPNSTLSDKRARIYALWFAGKVERTAKKIRRRFPDGLNEEFDMTALFAALDKKNATTRERVFVTNQNVTTEAEKAAQKAEVIRLHNEFKEAKAIFKSEEKRLNKYNIAVWDWNGAKELLLERDRFAQYDLIECEYEKAKADVEQEELDYRAEQQRIAEEKAAEKARLLKERNAKKAAKKGVALADDEVETEEVETTDEVKTEDNEE
jgi:Na+/melibiose symporter-like transporter